VTRGSLSHNRTFIAEGTWGAQIIDDLKPQEGEHLVVKKGFGGFSNTPLDTILRNMAVNTCVVTGVTTCVCVSTTIRGGGAEVHRDTHEADERVAAKVREGKSLDDIKKEVTMPEYASWASQDRMPTNIEAAYPGNRRRWRCGLHRTQPHRNAASQRT
jgi:hypothetical protein